MIDQKLINVYVAELEALRDHGREFAKAFPDVAGRLDIGAQRSRDPHVERVVESSAFLAARIKMMIREDATELPLAVLSLLAPSLTEPIPSMAILRFHGGSEAENLPRDSRFDFEPGGQTLSCFSTTMDTTIQPLALHVRRLEPSAGHRDGIGVRVRGAAPQGRVLFYLGSNRINAATLLDALDSALAGITVASADGAVRSRLPATSVRIHGLIDPEASLPVRPAVHPAHRVVAEFMAFPEKFRFVSIAGAVLRPGSEIQFWFSRRVDLPETLPQDLITVNRVPAINLWRTPAKPFDVSGRQLEYPVRVDALRYRSTECHSVESVDLLGSSGQPERIDPVASFGGIRGTSTRWGVRRHHSKGGAEVVLYFQGLDFGMLGSERTLAAPTVLASNRDIAARTPTGAALQPVDAIGDWRCALALAPSPYRAPLTAGNSMETLVGYLRSSMTSLADGGVRHLRDFLSQFPGGRQAGWTRGVRAVSVRPVASVVAGDPQPGIGITLAFDQRSHRATSAAVLKRVLGLLYESQRGINRVQSVTVRS